MRSMNNGPTGGPAGNRTRSFGLQNRGTPFVLRAHGWSRGESNPCFFRAREVCARHHCGPMVEMGGIEPPFRDCRSRVLPLDDIPETSCAPSPGEGDEPTMNPKDPRWKIRTASDDEPAYNANHPVFKATKAWTEKAYPRS